MRQAELIEVAKIAAKAVEKGVDKQGAHWEKLVIDLCSIVNLIEPIQLQPLEWSKQKGVGRETAPSIIGTFVIEEGKAVKLVSSFNAAEVRWRDIGGNEHDCKQRAWEYYNSFLLSKIFSQGA